MQTIRLEYITWNGKPAAVDMTPPEARQAVAAMRVMIAEIEASLNQTAIIHPPVACMPPLAAVGDAPDAPDVEG